MANQTGAVQCCEEESCVDDVAATTAATTPAEHVLYELITRQAT